MGTQEAMKRFEALSDELHTRLGLRGRGLSARLGRAGRLLPRRLRRAGALIAEAERRMQHPGLARTVDHARLDAAFAEFDTYLKGIDPADRRKGRILGWLGAQVFNLLLAAALLIALLRWRGVI